MNGSAGNDLFIIQNDALVDWVQDFELGTDNIRLVDGITFEQLDITGNGNSFIAYQGQEIAVSLGVSPDNLNADSFQAV